jgi:hypothetical protein
MGDDGFEHDEFAAQRRRASRLAARRRHSLRGTYERHPTLLRNIVVFAGFIVLVVLTVERVALH